MASINLDIDFFEHPKTKRLIRLLGKGSEVVPLRLWCYTAKYFAVDGRLTGISAQEIEEECRWWGQIGDAVKAMVDCGFLETDGDIFVVHDWEEHEGHISAFKNRAAAGAKARWDKYRGSSSNACSSAISTSSSNAPTVHNRTKHNQTNQRECPAEPDEMPPGLLRFWQSWPKSERKIGLKKCVPYWKKNGLEVIADVVIEALERSKKSNDWNKENGKYIPMPMSWLNKAPWETDPADLQPETLADRIKDALEKEKASNGKGIA